MIIPRLFSHRKTQTRCAAVAVFLYLWNLGGMRKNYDLCLTLHIGKALLANKLALEENNIISVAAEEACGNVFL